MPHLHLSLQSGADLILKRMKRRHSRADALAFCRKALALRPGLVLGADVIAGFPTETQEHAAETESLIAECGITHLHVFPYSPRPGTPAARMPPVPPASAKARAARLRALGQAALARHLDAQVGRALTLLTERGGRGRAEDFTAMRLPEGPPGRIIDAVAMGHDGRELIGAVAAPQDGRAERPQSRRGAAREG
jgi:threonylcarbamoyladenosine tRNA methylthiotransferase MtaB